MQTTQTAPAGRMNQPAGSAEPIAAAAHAVADQLPVAMTPAEQALVQDYDLKRRQRLMVRIGGIIGALATVLLILIIVGDTTRAASVEAPFALRFIEYIIVGGTAASFVSSGALARTGRVQAATLIFALGAGVFSPLTVLYSSLTNFFDPGNWLFLAGAIILVSVVGARWMIVATTLFSSVIFGVCYVIAPRPAFIAGYYSHDGPTIIGITLVFYWGIALLFVVQWSSFQRTLLALGAARVEVVRAKRLDELKDQFIRSVNHELRTPIMTILGYLDLLVNPQTPTRKVAPERASLYIENAYQAGQSLRALLASILDTRRLDLGELQSEAITPEPVALKVALAETLPMLPFDHETVERELHLSVPTEVIAWAEPVRVQQILTNLLTNALKYSPAGSPIEVSARDVAERATAGGGWRRRAGPERRMVEIAVRDHGLGVPADQIPLLFQRFARLQRDLESSVTGTGLGLYICRLLVERMGGRIWVESAGVPGDGSTFYVRLPAPPDATNVGQSVAGNVAGAAKVVTPG